MKVESQWGWRPNRPEGIWRHGCVWARPLLAAIPWITLCLLLALFALVDGRIAAAPGVSFELPDTFGPEAEQPGLVAFAMPMQRQDVASGESTLVFFDDSRYMLADDSSEEALRSRLAECAAADSSGVLLLIADRRVQSGALMRIAGIARDAGVVHMQIAEKKEASGR